MKLHESPAHIDYTNFSYAVCSVLLPPPLNPSSSPWAVGLGCGRRADYVGSGWGLLGPWAPWGWLAGRIGFKLVWQIGLPRLALGPPFLPQPPTLSRC